MSRSWQVTVASVDSLKHAEYRFGDFTERAGHTFLKVVKGPIPEKVLPSSFASAGSSASAAELASPEASDAEMEAGEASSEQPPEDAPKGSQSKRLGRVAVEVQVGTVRKRLKPFKVSGEVCVLVGESVLVPAPDYGDRMVARVLRVGHMQEDSLIGECDVEEATSTPTRLSLHRKTGKGNVKGFINLTVSPVIADCKPVALDPSAGPPDGSAGSKPLSYLIEKKNRMVDKYISAAPTKANGDMMRQPLLERSPDVPVVGECVVAIEAIRNLAPKVARPYFVLRLDGQEYRTDPDQLAGACQADLTYKFSFSSLQQNLYIHCYDDHGRSRTTALGRIILPLAGVVWGVGEAPSFGRLQGAVSSKAGKQLQHFEAQFMPMAGAGDGQNDPNFIDRYQPARKRKDGKAVAGTGMSKTQAFGLLGLRLEVTLEPSMRPPVKCYMKSMAARWGTLSQKEQEQEQEQNPQNQDLMSLMNSKVVQQAVRNCERLEAHMKAPARGILRWIRSKPWHGPVAGLSWFAFCCTGLFPPPAWAVPLYLWAIVLLNGVFEAFQREKDWAKTTDEAFSVWNEELEMKAPTLSELMGAFKKGVRQMERTSRITLGFLERGRNLLNFADGVATVLFALGLGLAALGLSLAMLLWSRVDPTGSWFFGLAGLALCFVLSSPEAKKPAQSGPKDPLAKLERLNRALECIPDQPEVAHRYIASRVQCLCKDVEALKVTIVNATGLRNADHLPGQGFSDPYCVCFIPGKPKSKFQTQVIDDDLNPVWNHEEIVTAFSVGDSLEFHIFDKDPGMTHDFLGKAKLASKQFLPHGFDGELNLLEAGKGIKAKIRIVVEVLRDVPALSHERTSALGP